MNYIAMPSIQPKYRKNNDKRLRNEILKTVCIEYSMSIPQIKSKGRKKELVECRQVACYIMRFYGNMSWVFIGEAVCQDHTTIIHAFNAVQAHIDTEEDYRLRVERLVTKIFS